MHLSFFQKLQKSRLVSVCRLLQFAAPTRVAAPPAVKEWEWELQARAAEQGVPGSQVASSSTHSVSEPLYTGVPAWVGDSLSLKMGDEAFHEWFRKDGEICYRNETGQDPIFCGQQEDCFIGMALPFINESTWDWRVRAVLYLVGLLYRWADRLEWKWVWWQIHQKPCHALKGWRINFSWCQHKNWHEFQFLQCNENFSAVLILRYCEFICILNWNCQCNNIKRLQWDCHPISLAKIVYYKIQGGKKPPKKCNFRTSINSNTPT